MGNAFIAWTPLHVINIINTAINYFPNNKNDLYIYDEFSGADKIYKKLAKMNLFRNVFKVSHKETGSVLSKGMNMLLNNQKLIVHDATYNNIFIQGGNYFSKILYGETKINNPDVKLHYIEDGLGAYTGSPIIRLDTPAKKIVKHLNKYSMYHAPIESFYVYEPNLVMEKENAPYFKLPKLNKQNHAFTIINDVFSIEQDATSKKMTDKILFFDQPFLKGGSSINEIKFVNEIKNMNTKFPITIKFHPRSSRDKYGDVDVLETDLPWELFCLNLELDNVYLLSIATTAAFTPYLMFGIEMPVIMLASYYLSIFNQEEENTETIATLKNLVEFAKNYQKNTGAIIYMPNSLEELSTLLR